MYTLSPSFLWGASTLACRGAPPADEAITPADCPIFNSPGKLPSSVDEALNLKKGGVHFSNKEIRAKYVCAAAAIGGLNEGWKKEGLSAEERAKRAFQTRHDARVISRAMMSDAAEVKALEDRDREKYGQPDGPTFDQLVKKAQEKGLSGDAVFEEIVASAQRTDAATNQALGIK
ncbi:MAG: hypothetical protein IPK82_43595 [Polyangiaceae bacterium]|nr:hypothetical protein [Polyangiaceae bacterium]